MNDSDAPKYVATYISDYINVDLYGDEILLAFLVPKIMENS